jgi:hypothetical protein
MTQNEIEKLQDELNQLRKENQELLRQIGLRKRLKFDTYGIQWGGAGTINIANLLSKRQRLHLWPGQFTTLRHEIDSAYHWAMLNAHELRFKTDREETQFKSYYKWLSDNSYLNIV